MCDYYVLILLSIADSYCPERLFYKEYGELIADSRIDAWIYGHSHTNIDTEIGGTRIISNQMGYVFEDEHLMNGFDPAKFISI